MPDNEGVPSTSAATAESAALADNIIKFPSTNIAFDVGSALDEVMEAYDKRREMLAVANGPGHLERRDNQIITFGY